MFVASSPKNIEGVGPLSRLVTYTCGGQFAKGHTYLLLAYTCCGQMSQGSAYMLVAYTCSGLMSKGHTYMLVGCIHLRCTNA